MNTPLEQNCFKPTRVVKTKGMLLTAFNPWYTLFELHNLHVVGVRMDCKPNPQAISKKRTSIIITNKPRLANTMLSLL